MKNAKECALDVFKQRFWRVNHNHGDNTTYLTKLVKSVAEKVVGPISVLEVGSWMGHSALRFAAMPYVANVVCVDHWDRNQVENWKPGLQPEDWMNFMYEHFLSNCLHDGLEHKIYPMRMRSHEAALQLGKEGRRFDLIYLDGGHRSDIIWQDIVDYYPLAGTLCGDDWMFDKDPENVRWTVIEFAARHGELVEVDGNVWCLK